MREWIVTNGLGSYASLTYNNTNTRKYHGLLVASLNPPTERWVFVTNVYDEVIVGDKRYNLKENKPSFDFDLFPSFTYKFDEFTLKKTYLMQYGKNNTIIKYETKSKKPITIIHNPILNSRHIYDVNSQRYLEFEHDVFNGIITAKPNNTHHFLKIICKGSTFEPRHYWEELFYEKDHERRDSWIDNNVHLGQFSKKLKKTDEHNLILSLEKDINIDPEKIFTYESARKKKILQNANLEKKFDKLVLSSDNFIVKKDSAKSIIAGYHWFGDWGRDTLIALPGLTLVTKRLEEAEQILLNFAKYCKSGLIPNAFMEKDSVAVYNTVDASLWYIDRVFQYLKYTNDTEFAKIIWPTLQSIIDGYENGTEFGIVMDDDYLISHGPGLTWMDVKIGNYYPTPRNNKAVEIQALWYNALKIMSKIAKLNEKEDRYADLAKSVKKSFNSQFDKLYDVIDTKDESLRPNIVFLTSLDYLMIDKNLQKIIIKQIKENLLTIFGLRTLSMNNQNYKGSYIGGYNKDEAYHNGTVWPWLLGPFIKGYLRIYKTKKDRIYSYNKFLKPMIDVFGPNWDGSIYEIFDGSPIYYPRGCISQAWSVAEILRAWVEDIENIKPLYESKLMINNY
jgi:predicted glycogen debranching enzyme